MCDGVSLVGERSERFTYGQSCHYFDSGDDNEERQPQAQVDTIRATKKWSGSRTTLLDGLTIELPGEGQEEVTEVEELPQEHVEVIHLAP